MLNVLKRILLGLALVAGVVVLVVVVYAARFLRSLDTPEFKKALLEQARAALGVEVRAADLQMSVLKGVELKTVTVDNPPGFAGPLLTADAFALHYDLLPLLRGRVQVDELVLKRPSLALSMDSRGAFNYEKLGAASGRSAAAPGSGFSLGVLDVVLSKMALDDARMTVTDARRAVLFKAEGMDLKSTFALRGGELEGSGRAGFALLSLASALQVRDLSAPLVISKRRMSLAPIRGRLAEGDASGDLSVDLVPFGYRLKLDVSGAKVEKLLQEAGSSPMVSGRLRANGSFEGTAGVSSVKGKATAEVQGCRASRAPLLAILAATLQLPELADPDFDECRAEFTLASGRAHTPVISLKGKAVRLSGQGTMVVESGALDYGMTLSLATRLVDRIPAKEIRSAFEDRGEGFRSLDFRVTGTTAAPHTDILARIGKASLISAVKGKLGGLFHKHN
jgi:AsmA-like C-terminal region/AsmA family